MTLVTPPPQTCNFGHFGTLAHGPVLSNKVDETGDVELASVLSEYDNFIQAAQRINFILGDENSQNQAIDSLTDLLNAYRGIALPILEKRENSGQENLRSTIMEEFFQLLLSPLTAKVRANHPYAVKLGKANSYVSLTFTPRNFNSLYENPAPNIHTKDQDFVLGCLVELTSKVRQGAGDTTIPVAVEVVVPVIAIECKTYIERNMLDSCAGTAKRLKSAMPYCLYIVAAEYMKMDDAYPELTDIDEVFIFTKASNADRLRFQREGRAPHGIAPDLVRDIFNMAYDHLNRVWWSPQEALGRGRVIARP